MPKSPSAVARGPITRRVLVELETEGFPVGDNQAPEAEYGWSGEPNGENSTFTPWMTLQPLMGQTQRQSGALSDTGTEWSLPYGVFYTGLTRAHVEALADKMRKALTDITREVVETVNGNWKIQKISCSTLGTVNRVGSTYPDYFTQTDTFDVWVSKER